MNNDTELSDEEKSYDEWVTKNLLYIHNHKQSITVMKKLYIEGFRAGMSYIGRLNSETQLQK